MIDRIEELIPQFDLFLFDQYGVLHDGVNAYAGMPEVLQTIKSAGRKIGVISNSGKRSEYNASRLQRFGFGPELVDDVMTSGEVAWQILRQLTRDNLRDPASEPIKVYFLGRGSDRSAIDDLPLEETRDVAAAELLIISGHEPDRLSLDDYAELLQPAAIREVPAYCTNPDRISLSGNGQSSYGPGEIADRYEASGGQVKWIGKPYPAIYHAALDRFQTDASRAVCIGDSIEHDIKGAQHAGCASVLVATGIYQGCEPLKLAELFTEFSAVPDFQLSMAD